MLWIIVYKNLKVKMNLNNIKGRKQFLPIFLYFLKRYYNINRKDIKIGGYFYVETKKEKEIQK